MLCIVNKLLETKWLLTSPGNVLPQVNFPANNLNFHWRWRWWDQIQAIFLNLFYFLKISKVRRFSYATRQKFYPTVFSQKIWKKDIAVGMYRKRKSEKEWKSEILWNHHTTRSLSSFSRFFSWFLFLFRRLRNLATISVHVKKLKS